MLKNIFIVVLLSLCNNLKAQSKYEFRGAWIATIGGIDWPSPAVRGKCYEQQQEFVNLLNKLEECGINAVIVQIRPAADAFYKSSYEAWSKYLTGVQGMAPDPYYDPLNFMIEEAHRKGMEFHAWFNPFRALIDASKNIHPSNHVTFTHPDWFVNYGGKKYFDPGIPNARNYVIEVVKEVVRNYDIDAVHFDDYFYPYKIGKTPFPDNNSFYSYNTQGLSKEDWRRNNVNVFVQDVYNSIKKIKPLVQFGISPFGVWRNISKDPDGSNTTAGTTNYDDLYADVVYWQKHACVDYILPQLYWEQGHHAADYTTLLDWWSNHTYNRAMYIGHGLYQYGANKAAAWHSSNEIIEQVQLLRNYKTINGSCYYSTTAFIKNKYNIAETIQYSINNYKAIMSPMKWLDSLVPPPPSINSIQVFEGIISTNLKHNCNDARFFVVYRFLNTEKINIQSTKNIYRVTNTDKMIIDSEKGKYKFVVTTLDKAHNESKYVALEKSKSN
jgi:uncharacterized lipoprotein YddW (UPF0748 family)